MKIIGLLVVAFALSYSAHAESFTVRGYLRAQETYKSDPENYNKTCPADDDAGCRVFYPQLVTRITDLTHIGVRDAAAAFYFKGRSVPQIFNFNGTELAVGDLVEITGEISSKPEFTRVTSIKILDRQVRLTCQSLPNSDEPIHLYFLRSDRSYDDFSTFMRADMGGTEILAGVDVLPQARSTEITGTSFSRDGYYWIHPYLKKLINAARPTGTKSADAIFTRLDVERTMSLSLPERYVDDSTANATLTVAVHLPDYEGYAATKNFEVVCRPIQF